MPRIVRRKPLRDRILAKLNPLELWIDLYTYIEGYDWENIQSSTSAPLGLALNILLLVARVNSNRNSSSYAYSDVLRTPSSGGLRSYDRLGYFLWILSWILMGSSILNAVLCFTKKRKYRMFEANIAVEPSTPNARLVKLGQSPPSNAVKALFSSPAKSPSSLDSKEDVWEITVWDPTPISLTIFSFFSPAHAAIYFLTFPIETTSPLVTTHYTPTTSVVPTYLTVFIIQCLLSYQLTQLISAFTQQAIDRAIINKEVFREYDHKYVHPRLSTIKRDVAVQCSDDHFEASVDIYTPTFDRMGFTIHSNPKLRHHTYTGVVSEPVRVASLEQNTPLVDRQLRREQQRTAGLSGQFRRGEDGVPIKSEYDQQKRVNNVSATSTGREGFFSTAARERREREKWNRERQKRGSDAFATIYPDLSDNDENDDNDDHDHRQQQQEPALSTSEGSHAGIRTAKLYNTPSASSLDEHTFSPRPDSFRNRPATATSQKQTQAPSTPSRHPSFRPVNTNAGMAGLVNMSIENSRNLSPQKMSSPFKKGSKARASSYAASIFGTPGRR